MLYYLNTTNYFLFSLITRFHKQGRNIILRNYWGKWKHIGVKNMFHKLLIYCAYIKSIEENPRICFLLITTQML